MKRFHSVLFASALASLLVLSPTTAVAEGGSNKGDNSHPAPPDNRPPNCPGNSCKPKSEPTPTTLVVVVPNVVTGIAAPVGVVHGTQDLTAKNEAELNANQTLRGTVNQHVGATAGGNNLKTGDNTLKDSGNSKLDSKIAVGVEGSKQTQEAKALATNEGVTNSVHIDQRQVRQAVQAYAPPVYQQGGCPGNSTSGGIGGTFGGISFGSGALDKECQINAAETTVLQLNQQRAYGARLSARFALRMRCKSELLGFTSDECAAMEKEVMAQHDSNAQTAEKLAADERIRLEAEIGKLRRENQLQATSTPESVTLAQLRAELAALKADLAVRVQVPTQSVKESQRKCELVEFVNKSTGKTEKACIGSKTGHYTHREVVDGVATAAMTVKAEAGTKK